MATYCMGDLHGQYGAYLQMLDKLRISDSDTLYIIGDMVDRGPKPLTLVRDIMGRANVVALAGNHEAMACACLRRLIHGGRADELDEEAMMNILRWQQEGGAPTLSEFRSLTVPERQAIVEWMGELELYREIEAGKKRFVLVHAGLGEDFDPARPLDDYEVEDYLMARTDYGRVYFPDRYLVTGHTPTRLIPGNPRPDRIYRANNHIAVDCGSVFGGRLGAICLETGEEYYV